ncbi:MAG: Na/Pi cotransporter family protein [Firmicutes bacterium]|nr:Na/Pi cotransporter family protein [Bacillota bacterium]
MTIFNAISLLGGLALFLYGMRIMGDGLSQSSSAAFRNALKKVTNNPVAGFLVGVIVTAVIQSSTATIVITSGLVGAGLMTFKQSIGIMLGANVGTTVTAQIIRLLDINADSGSVLNFFKPSTLAPIAAIIGIVCIMFIKKQSSGTVGQIAMGFGILFTGLLNMTAAVSPLSEEPWFANMFMSVSERPLLGFIAGAAAAFLIQSSSATIGILQALATTGVLTFSSVYSIIIGIYIGDCVTTAIVCSIGAKADAKRTGIAHILFNLCVVVLVSAGVAILHSTGVLSDIWSRSITSGGIANTHTIFRLACAVILLPFTRVLETVTKKIVKDAPVSAAPEKFKDVELLDKALYRSPAIALSSVRQAMIRIATAAEANYHMAHSLIHSYSEETAKKIEEQENFIDFMTDHVSAYLVGLSTHVSGRDSDIVNFNIKCVLEYERIGDLALNLSQNALELKQKNMQFSEVAKLEMDVLHNALSEVLDSAVSAYRNRSIDSARHIEPVEEVVDELVESLRARHVNRLQTGECNVVVGSTFLDMLVNIERISDQCSNIGVYTVALFEPDAFVDQHTYLSALHRGENEGFNADYKAAREKYGKLLEMAEQGMRIPEPSELLA